MAFRLPSHGANVQGTRVVCGSWSASENSNSRCLESVRVDNARRLVYPREKKGVLLVHILAFIFVPFSLRWLARRVIGFG